MGRGLSEQQQHVVRWIGDELIRIQERYDEADAEHRRSPFRLGVKCSAWEQTPSGWASWSRTLRRLEERGLIDRRGFFGDRRLTPAGWTLYEQLTGKTRPAGIVLRAFGEYHLAVIEADGVLRLEDVVPPPGQSFSADMAAQRERYRKGLEEDLIRYGDEIRAILAAAAPA
jgi:hypothetical protein